MNNLRQYRPIERGEFFVVGVDLSAGMGDYSCAQFMSKTKRDIPLVYHSKETATVMLPHLHRILEKLYDETGLEPVVAPERQNGGMFITDDLALMNEKGKYTVYGMIKRGNIHNNLPQVLGWDTTSASRPAMLSDLKEAVDKKLITIYDKPTITELYSFVLVQKTSIWKAQAEVGSHDDLVMSLAIAYQLYQSEDHPDLPEPKKPWEGKIPGTFVPPSPVEDEDSNDNEWGGKVVYES